jgi:hypothetical protein
LNLVLPLELKKEKVKLFSDTIWAPIEDKLGPWYMYLSLDGKIFAEKLFEVTAEDIEEENERKFWKRRGF